MRQNNFDENVLHPVILRRSNHLDRRLFELLYLIRFYFALESSKEECHGKETMTELRKMKN